MAARKLDINDFNARIKSIKNPRNTSYYDRDMEMHVPKRVSRDKINGKKAEESFLSLAVVSMVLGALAVFIAQIVRIRYFGLTGQSNVVLAIEALVTVWALILLTALADKRRITERIAQIAGIAVMIVAGHNLIWRWPDQMAIVYTQAHVEQVMDATTQHSIVYRGSVYGL
jgi:hypothetical protein